MRGSWTMLDGLVFEAWTPRGWRAIVGNEQVSVSIKSFQERANGPLMPT